MGCQDVPADALVAGIKAARDVADAELDGDGDPALHRVARKCMVNVLDTVRRGVVEAMGPGADDLDAQLRPYTSGC